MNATPTVVVTRPSPLATLIRSVCGLLMVLAVCATAWGIFGSRAVQGVELRVEDLLSQATEALAATDNWRSLPPILVDVCNDRRDADYRQALQIRKLVHAGGARFAEGQAVVAVDVTNAGDKVVSHLVLRLAVSDEGPESFEKTLWVATPIALDTDEWRGPLLPGATRRVFLDVWRVKGEMEVAPEVVELRTWRGPVQGG